MRLLFDQNLSPRLVTILSELYPASVHVRDAALQCATDAEIWAYARQNGLAIITKDSDFRQRSFLLGAPPKVIWVQLGNCSTDDIARLIWVQHPKIQRFLAHPEAAFLALR